MTYTFWSICKDAEFSKIEIPIIQRDYVQGRKGEEDIRDKFVDYLVDSLINNNKIEVDFVYGSTLTSSDQKVFIPVDGQQRLTTLFLLHWYVALHECQLTEDVICVLSRFNYETRPSTLQFCRNILSEKISKSGGSLVERIKNSYWYNDEWDSDNSISAMLNMITAFVSNADLNNNIGELWGRLTTGKLISFYFVSLEDFGLTENIYLRMNARGKVLTYFENFKSEFYKYIQDNELAEVIKDSIEYKWVEYLWDYRVDGEYVIDTPFMNYLKHITEMLYYRNNPYENDHYNGDFLDFKVLKQVYTDSNNITFLKFALDSISETKEMHDIIIPWSKNNSVAKILKSIARGEPNEDIHLILHYSTLLYKYSKNSNDDFVDFIRVVRNLFGNTADSSRREWNRILKSIHKLISDSHVLETLCSDIQLEGFYIPQREEEKFKAKLLLNGDGNNYRDMIINAENTILQGNITSLIAASYCSDEKALLAFKINQADYVSFDSKLFSELLCGYIDISKNDFYDIWGDLLVTTVYTHQTWGRLVYIDTYEKSPGLMMWNKEYVASKKILDKFIISNEKEFIKDMLVKYQNLEMCNNVKEQLYLYYIISRRLMSLSHTDFFGNDYNFGWLSKEVGYTSVFKNGILDDAWFTKINPIFQRYSSQFRYNMGIQRRNSLNVEVVGGGKPQQVFEKLKEWSKS